MMDIRKEGILLEPTELDFERHGVLNPSCVQDGKNVHLFYRAVREGNYSSIGHARLDGPMNVVERSIVPVLEPSEPYDVHGVEDPRVVLFEGVYYMFHTAYDGNNARVALATSEDMKTWTKKGIVSADVTYEDAEKLFRKAKLKDAYQMFSAYLQHRHGQTDKPIHLWDKDAFIFPERIEGKIFFVHRILPDIQYALIDSVEQLSDQEWWREQLGQMDKNVLMENTYWFENRNIGAGGPPIKTKHGWLMIFHSVQSQNSGKAYSAAAALLDLKNPSIVIARTKEPLFVPEEDWELNGDVDNVVFPTGNAVFDGRLYMYYGAADSRIAVASVEVEELLHELLSRWTV